ncbi:hypothetical protein CEXT_78321 [Caerostris extrusa]|uniref:Uncharacterized protein n=1 Tax=Caerostris extrusa TaxID=172846 RepID=A0AAV4RVU1_CAEEX|nr:hypothetical protein CEXT_78321 [Caerostris extrusa]
MSKVELITVLVKENIRRIVSSKIDNSPGFLFHVFSKPATAKKLRFNFGIAFRPLMQIDAYQRELSNIDGRGNLATWIDFVSPTPCFFLPVHYNHAVRESLASQKSAFYAGVSGSSST